MEHQKIMNLLDNAKNEQSKFRAKNGAEINDGSQETYNKDNQIIKLNFKASVMRLNLCDYSDVYILAIGTIATDGEGVNDAGKQADKKNKELTFKNYAPFIEYISNININHIDNAKDIDVVMPMYNLIEYSDN